jgi:chromosome segregation ATPase
MLFVCVFLSIVFGLNCLVMSNLTVEDLNRALEEKLVPLTKKIEETNTAITFINHKYEEILCKLSAYESERKELMNENKCLKSQLLATTNKLNVMAEEINNLEQYSRAIFYKRKY